MDKLDNKHIHIGRSNFKPSQHTPFPPKSSQQIANTTIQCQFLSNPLESTLNKQTNN